MATPYEKNRNGSAMDVVRLFVVESEQILPPINDISVFLNSLEESFGRDIHYELMTDGLVYPLLFLLIIPAESYNTFRIHDIYRKVMGSLERILSELSDAASRRTYVNTALQLLLVKLRGLLEPLEDHWYLSFDSVGEYPKIANVAQEWTQRVMARTRDFELEQMPPKRNSAQSRLGLVCTSIQQSNAVIFNLPTELLTLCASFVTTEAWLSLRLTCHLLAEVADRYVWRKVRVRFTQQDLSCASLVLENKRIAQNVRELDVIPIPYTIDMRSFAFLADSHTQVMRIAETFPALVHYLLTELYNQNRKEVALHEVLEKTRFIRRLGVKGHMWNLKDFPNEFCWGNEPQGRGLLETTAIQKCTLPHLEHFAMSDVAPAVLTVWQQALASRSILRASALRLKLDYEVTANLQALRCSIQEHLPSVIQSTCCQKLELHGPQVTSADDVIRPHLWPFHHHILLLDALRHLSPHLKVLLAHNVYITSEAATRDILNYKTLKELRISNVEFNNLSYVQLIDCLTNSFTQSEITALHLSGLWWAKRRTLSVYYKVPDTVVRHVQDFDKLRRLQPVQL